MRKKFFLVGFILLLLVAVPVTVFLVQREQRIRSNATPATTLSFDPTTKSAAIDETFSLNVTMNTNANSVSNAEIHIRFDPAKLMVLEMKAGSFMPHVLVPSTPDNTAGTAFIFVDTLSAGAGANDVPFIKQSSVPEPVAVITFKTKAETGGTPTVVEFTQDTKAYGSTNGTLETTSVISSLSNKAAITITAAGAAAAGETPAPTPTVTPTPTETAANPTSTPTPTPTSAPGARNKAPDCNSLTASPDKGNIPLTVTLTANANDENDDITSAIFTFGDGQTQTVDKNIGQSGSFQVTHVYQNTGTIKPQAIVKDINGAASDACTDTITIAAAGATPTPTAAAAGGGAAQATPTPAPVAAIPTTGNITPISAITLSGAALMLLGGLLFFVL